MLHQLRDTPLCKLSMSTKFAFEHELHTILKQCSQCRAADFLQYSQAAAPWQCTIQEAHPDCSAGSKRGTHLARMVTASSTAEQLVEAVHKPARTSGGDDMLSMLSMHQCLTILTRQSRLSRHSVLVCLSMHYVPDMSCNARLSDRRTTVNTQRVLSDMKSKQLISKTNMCIKHTRNNKTMRQSIASCIVEKPHCLKRPRALCCTVYTVMQGLQGFLETRIIIQKCIII